MRACTTQFYYFSDRFGTSCPSFVPLSGLFEQMILEGRFRKDNARDELVKH
jgi:hypothetical protein